MLLYTGNIHDSNVSEVRSLYLAVGVLRDEGLPVRLVKTGNNRVDMSWATEAGLGEVVLDLGFVARERVWQLLALADALVQPGGPNAFNDYRFPSKLPDYLVSGKPVVLPNTNIGRYLRDGVDALLLQRESAADIAAAVRRLLGDDELCRRLGPTEEVPRRRAPLDTNVEPILALYASIWPG